MYDADFGHWFTGLVDGEGCFHARVHIRKSDQTKCLVVYFVLKLRADDAPMLNTVKETLGVGAIYQDEEKLSKWPQADYRVNHRDDLRKVIIPQFDTYPLHSKKARDYAVWREIVLKYKCRHTRSLTDHQWGTVKWMVDSLKQGRQFDPDIAKIARERVALTQPPLFVPQASQVEMVI